MAHRNCGCPVKPGEDSTSRTQPVKRVVHLPEAGSCNRSIALSGSTNTLCTSKSLIHKVSTNASWCRVMTLDGFIGGKDIGSLIGWITLLLSRTWMMFTATWTVVALNSLFFWHLDRQPGRPVCS